MEDQAPKKRNPRIFIILGIVILVGGFFGVKTILYSRNHITTDDAQIDGNIYPVLARVSGYVDSINCSENHLVQQGMLLIKLDDRDLKIKVEQAEAALQNAQANVGVSNAAIVTAEANVATAKATVDNATVKVWKATQDFNRYDKLLKENTVTQQQFDAAKSDKESMETALEVAKKQFNASQMLLQSTNDQVKVTETTVKQRQSDLDFANLQLSYARIFSPATGIVAKKNVQVGQFVQGGQPLFSIVQDSSIWITANFKETQMQGMKEGQKVEITVDAYSGLDVTGVVESISGETGARSSLLPPDNASGNFVKVVQRVPVKIKITADKETMKKLRPGMSVTVAVVTE